ncbi:hypothetical protein PHMEG_0004251 [Phytophthora megakarya]|uniref:HAT C-terminal dimerisation domain-containing protein n=1 Tax=Phytophthora megakarya TaxID=4795 RepID=A0A225WUB4_9STRA|nr:hypothetical protein PHMEG_0004251 [Phytophthora megakarya]
MWPMIWSSGTTGSEAHTGEFMASEISHVIGEVEVVAGVGKVITVVSDNAANIRKAGGLVERKHPNVIYNGCSAHAANLVLKYMFKIKLFTDALKKAVKFGDFCSSKAFTVGSRKDQASPASERSKSRRVVSPHLDPVEKCVKSIIRNRGPLKAAFADPELMKRYADPATAKKLDEARAIIQDKQYWAAAKVVIKLTKPITQALAVFESDTCCNSMIMHEFERLKQAPENTKPIPGLFDSSVQAAILNLVENAESSFTLPPIRQESRNPLRDTVDDAVKLVKSFGLPAQVNPNGFRFELLDFIGMKKSHSAENKLKDSADPPLHMWLMDENYPNLFHFGVKVLSIPTSSAASERLWCVRGFTQSKLRSRFRVATVEKLAFIYLNTDDAKRTSSDWAGGCASDYDNSEDEEDDDCLFDLSYIEFEYLLDVIVSMNTACEQD